MDNAPSSSPPPIEDTPPLPPVQSDPETSVPRDHELAIMKREIDALQIAVTGSSNPWYKSASTIISVVALLFSFSTTYVSYRRSEVQDTQNLRQELRTLLQRLAALPKENLEFSKKYAGDPQSVSLVSGFVNQENALLARQAAEIAKRLPREMVSATEYYAIAVASQNSYELQTAKEFLDLSLQVARDFNAEISALRAQAHLKFMTGDPAGGRADYEKALAIFTRYPGFDAFTQTTTHVWSHLGWALSEASVGAMPGAREHDNEAERLVGTVPASPGAEMLRSHVAQSRQQLVGGAPLPTADAGSQFAFPPAR